KGLAPWRSEPRCGRSSGRFEMSERRACALVGLGRWTRCWSIAESWFVKRDRKMIGSSIKCRRRRQTGASRNGVNEHRVFSVECRSHLTTETNHDTEMDCAMRSRIAAFPPRLGLRPYVPTGCPEVGEEGEQRWWG